MGTIQEERWEGKATVPSAFLPANVSAFNMFAIHKATLIEEDQAWEDGKIYEALFPVEEGSQPDFHNLAVFQLELSSCGQKVLRTPLSKSFGKIYSPKFLSLF